MSARGTRDPRDIAIERQQFALKDYLSEIARLEQALADADGCAVRFAKLYEIETKRNGHKADMHRHPDLLICIKRTVARLNGRYSGVTENDDATEVRK